MNLTKIKEFLSNHKGAIIGSTLGVVATTATFLAISTFVPALVFMGLTCSPLALAIGGAAIAAGIAALTTWFCTREKVESAPVTEKSEGQKPPQNENTEQSENLNAEKQVGDLQNRLEQPGSSMDSNKPSVSVSPVNG